MERHPRHDEPAHPLLLRFFPLSAGHRGDQPSVLGVFQCVRGMTTARVCFVRALIPLLATGKSIDFVG
ncbi:MAG: hypothetical protein ABW185_29630 [Sedimenticola sp.]